MRFFYISALCFIAMVTLTVFNSVYIESFCNEVITSLNEITNPEVSADIIKDIKNYTDRTLKKMEFSIPRQKIDTVRDHLDLLIIEVENGEITEFKKTRQLLINQLTEIKELEKPRF